MKSIGLELTNVAYPITIGGADRVSQWHFINYATYFRYLNIQITCNMNGNYRIFENGTCYLVKRDPVIQDAW